MTTLRVPDFVHDSSLPPLPCASHRIDPDLFFPHWSDSTTKQLAEAICGPCPVRDACRAHGRDQRERGIWGGETETQRRRAVNVPRKGTSKRRVRT
ncbi:hypothetical protein SSP24_79020 [Streptomyces spinoverrucosus]|uniref:4Fe-4S Wbl-type domain-containing protein n=1 Tax=Streptomyces spinoverrucosus TaxID=284043 RepID=A0A4Y3VTS1_9ACTN|nr:WhiB family transcriptional regulator [Streptomyces spinoverrucosus]GEC10247.1 hypothetical protein SSP24_79020 [Streptomyces spinoverrucosus]GHB97867.1 hypothetical protein GCM10010397_83000 [Streptomyces spinoverrucosus]